MDRSNLIVNYLQTNVNEEDLDRLFSEYGVIQSLKIVRDKATGISMGFGFVNFETNDAASQAAEALNGLELQGKRIKVSVARPAWKANIHSNLYIANLPTGFTENDVISLVGPELALHVEHVRMLKNSDIHGGTHGAGGNEFRSVAVARFDTEESAMIALEFLNSISVCSLSNPNLRCPVHAKPWRPEFRPERASGVSVPMHRSRDSFTDSSSISDASGGYGYDGAPNGYAPMGVPSGGNAPSTIKLSGLPHATSTPKPIGNLSTPLKPFIPAKWRVGLSGSTAPPPAPPAPSPVLAPAGYAAYAYPGPVLGPAMIPGPPPPPIVPSHMMLRPPMPSAMHGGYANTGGGSVITDSEEGILLSSFEQFGSLPGIQFFADRTWGYVRFPDHQAAMSAINNLTGFNINGKILELETAM
jgi:RNA recognition motif-containing protein